MSTGEFDLIGRYFSIQKGNQHFVDFSIGDDCAITHIPLVPDYIKGIINLRGQILPVVDIRLYMGKPALEYNSKTCFIVLNVDDLPVCIVVDSVQQVIDIDLQDVRPIPIKRRQKLLDGMITLENGTVLMSFDCKSLVSS